MMMITFGNLMSVLQKALLSYMLTVAESLLVPMALALMARAVLLPLPPSAEAAAGAAPCGRAQTWRCGLQINGDSIIDNEEKGPR